MVRVLHWCKGVGLLWQGQAFAGRAEHVEVKSPAAFQQPASMQQTGHALQGIDRLQGSG